MVTVHRNVFRAAVAYRDADQELESPRTPRRGAFLMVGTFCRFGILFYSAPLQILTERVPLESPGSIGAFFLAIVLVDQPIPVAARDDPLTLRKSQIL